VISNQDFDRQSPLNNAHPTVALIGAEFEENLSIRYLASSLEANGFRAELQPYNTNDQIEDIAADIIARQPAVVGISVPFQQRAVELLGIATVLRERGYKGHVCAGGHFATFEYQNILRDVHAIDSIVRHEGERPFVEICKMVREGREVTAVPGVVVRNKNGDGASVDCGEAHPLPDLDELPLPDRRGAPHEVLGIRCSPILGSRGCYADCSFCCINAYHQNAKGPRYRKRSPESVVEEMKLEYDRRGVRLFIFHDDNFFLPRRGLNIKRYRELRDLMTEAGMDDIGLVVKCRPNDVDPSLFRLLKSMGLIRAYVGIESNSEEGVVSLNRRLTPADNARALETLRDLGVYCSFNVLIFDPAATFNGIERNLAFMEKHADAPFNFCRAEVYAGTPLKKTLESEKRLEGDYLAWNYRMRDKRVELLFRIAVTAFHSRNFKPDGIANLNMGIRFDNEVMRRFYRGAWDPEWHRGLISFSRRVGADSVEHMRRAVAFARETSLTDFDAANRFTLDLARQISQADLSFLKEVKDFRREMERRTK
jgi:radical SAM superfamily enzyme YgiQ (UPF0313 family)